MALATQCPHCQTTFRVVHDQLKLRAGLVRCGSCKEIFNGIENLLPPEDAAPASPTLDKPVSTISTPATPSSAQQYPTPTEEREDVVAQDAEIAAPVPAAKEVTTTDEQQARTTLAEAAEQYPTSHLSFVLPPHFEREATSVYGKDDPKPEDPLQRMTLMDFSAELPSEIEGPPDQRAKVEDDDVSSPSFETHDPDELDKAMDDLQRKPWRNRKKSSPDETEAIDELDDEEPGFVRKERARQQMSQRTRTILISASVVLFIVAVLQSSYVFRNQLAGIFPQVKPVFVKLCSGIGCRIDLPANISSVTIESNELQRQTPDGRLFVLTTLLRNSSSLAQEWPSIELTLNDANEKALLRRVFSPSDYLRDDFMVSLGIAGETERTVRIAFELDDVRASGYRVYLFYP